MGMFGGIIASGMAQGAQNASDIAQQQIDVNNKEQLATFQQGLDVDKMKQAEAIRQSGVMFGYSQPVTDAANAASASKISSDAAAHADPGTLANEDIADAHKPFNLHPGEEHFAGGAPGAKLTPIASNDKMTAADARFAVGGMYNRGAAADAKAAHYTAEEEQNANHGLSTDVKDAFKGPDGNVNPVALVAAKQAYVASLQSGKMPVDAANDGLAEAGRAVQLVAAARQRYPDQTKGKSDAQIYQTINAARGAPSRAAPAGPQPSGDSSRAPAPSKDPATMRDNAPAPAAAAPAPAPAAEPGILGSAFNTVKGQVSNLVSNALADPGPAPAPASPDTPAQAAARIRNAQANMRGVR